MTESTINRDNNGMVVGGDVNSNSIYVIHPPSLGLQIYQDVAQGCAQIVGKTLELATAKTVDAALISCSSLIWGFDRIRDFVSNKVADLLKDVPAENIASPAPNVAVPILEALRYIGHESSLSDLYANLLAASMNKSIKNGAHPAFVEIIKQLTPDEAKLIKLLADPISFPLLTVKWEYKNPTAEKNGGQNVVVNFSNLGHDASLEFPELTPTYIDNLCRLHLTQIPPALVYTTPGIYSSLENAPDIQKKKMEIETNPELKCVLQRNGLLVTEFGKQFIKICAP